MIEVDHAIKKFGSKKALDALSFTIEEGKIIGLLGTNGAGKSTLLKVLMGLQRLDNGRITIDGKVPSLSTRGMMAYLPDIDVWYPWMKLSDVMQYMKDIYWDWNVKKSHKLLEFFELEKDTFIKDASKGTKAKIKLLLALSRQVKYLLLDEPFSGIDPFARQQIATAIVDDFVEEGQTIIITTHEIAEVEKLLDEVVFIHEGKLLLKGHVESLKMEKSMSLMDILEEVYNHARI
ncbi:ABC transporter ATP-binding protein [Neobacillus sp.]|uniref:ABC transporter ATP-binding protein n=1 Tax=Neobacillus sp. TaxID=2675273 RepID=UPI002897155F|nr:ABC transporter ATP-binding protein [Neobacillus sp.]